VWGGLHGIYLASSVIYKPWQKSLHSRIFLGPLQYLKKLWQTLFTFHLVCLAWVFFRAASLADAFEMLGRVVNSVADLKYLRSIGEILPEVTIKQQSFFDFCLMNLLLLLYFGMCLLLRERCLYRIILTKPLLMRWAAYVVLVIAIMAFAVIGDGNFLYFAF
jgi:hypothetical protein